GATIFSSVAIALEAGFLFGAVYMLTHRLAMCVGLHAAWNFAQGGIFGVAVSGKSAKGWMQSGLHGPDWLTGGVFGAEASLVAVLILVAVGAYIFWLVKQRGLLKLPYWKANLSLAF
ncbi:MAG: hypothetical protein KGM99_09025, partial [Burkholderiales bacterium]|nr:hypothetical protein [Burkholderiales bacterium]